MKITFGIVNKTTPQRTFDVPTIPRLGDTIVSDYGTVVVTDVAWFARLDDDGFNPVPHVTTVARPAPRKEPVDG